MSQLRQPVTFASMKVMPNPQLSKSRGALVPEAQMTIAQRFNAGLKATGGSSPAGTAEIIDWQFGRPCGTNEITSWFNPALKRWAIVGCPCGTKGSPRRWHWATLLLLFCQSIHSQMLPLPERSTNALSGSTFAARIGSLGLAEREEQIYTQISSGNMPLFLRKLCPVYVTNKVAGQTNTARFYATPDYLAIGSDEDYLLMPISPNTGQRLADALNCSLPTPKMVNDIYSAAPVKLTPSPIPPTAAMITVGVFSNHNSIVRSQRAAQLAAHPLGQLTAGHQKDVVISARLATAPGKVAIYGWHQTNGQPIQPLYLGHTAAWVDYSQCIRLVQQHCLVNGQPKTVAEVLADPALCGLLSDEGVVANSRYPTNALAGVKSGVRDEAAGLGSGLLNGSRTNDPVAFRPSQSFGERVASFTFDPEVKIHINAPAQESFTTGKKVLLIFYALPNGNATDQTIGRALKPGDDWHYDIQHIGAQTRFLRELLPERAVVVVYLEAGQKSWPAWRKKHGDVLIPQVLARGKALFAGHEIETVLSGHSGGGSFIFGYLNASEQIPDDVVRIAFLDSNYAYDPALRHRQKLVQWLNAGHNHCLCVLAYNDAVALLEGKPFVSAAGGTWGKSHQMQADLVKDFAFTSRTNAGFEKFLALDGRVQFLLKENAERKILHTVQVERNGFIHCLVCGTAKEGKGYEYFGPRAYSKWIQAEPAQ